MDLAKTIKALFSKLDTNGDGVLSREELTVFLQNQNSSWTESELETLFRCVDSDGDGHVSIKEFIEWSINPIKKQQQQEDQGQAPEELLKDSVPLRALQSYLNAVISRDQWFTDPVNMEKLDICKQAVQTSVVQFTVSEQEQVAEEDGKSKKEKKRDARLWEVAQTILPGLDLATQRRIALVGLAGSGKSTLAKQLSVLCAQTCLSSLADPDQVFAVPLRIPLTEISHLLEKGVKAADLLERWICSRFGDNPSQLETMMTCNREGNLLIYLDGLDETAGHLGEVKQWIADWVQNEAAAAQHIFIVSMRPSAYAPNYFNRLNFQSVFVTPLTKDLARQLVRQRLQTMGLGQDKVEAMEEQVTRPEFSALMEVPLLCTLLVHVLLQRGGAGPEETLQYIAREVLRRFGEDITDKIQDLKEPLLASLELYKDACEKLRASDEDAFVSLNGMPSKEVPEAEWDMLEQEVDLSDLNDKDSAYAQLALKRVLEHASKAQSKVKTLIAENSEWATKVGNPDEPLVTRRSVDPKLAPWIDGAVDPGIKGMSDNGERIQDKCNQLLPRLQEKGVAKQLPDAFKRCFDLSRFSFVYDSLSGLLRGAEEICSVFEVVCRSNRFKRPTPLGYRDMCLVIRVTLDDGSTHLSEIQLQLGPLLDAKKKGHGYYETIRKALPAGKVQQFIMDRLSSNRIEITQVDVGQEALSLMLLGMQAKREKGAQNAESPKRAELRRSGFDPGELRRTLRAVAWMVHMKHTRNITEEVIRGAAPSESMGDALWVAVRSGEIGLLEPVAHSDEISFQFFHLSFQTLLAGEHLADKVQSARKDPEEEASLAQLDIHFRDDWWSRVFLTAYEVLMGSPGGAPLTQWWIESMAERDDGAIKILYHAAAEDHQVKLMQTLLLASKGKVHADVFDYRGLSTLMKAAAGGSVEVVKGLLELKANPATPCRLFPELELLRGSVDDLKAEDCKVQPGTSETHKFMIGLPTAALKENDPQKDACSRWMFEMQIQEAPSMARSVHAVNFEKSNRLSTTTYQVDWHEVAVGWVQEEKASRAKNLKVQDLLGRSCEMRWGSTVPFSVAIGGDGICRCSADKFPREMMKHCAAQDVTGTMRRDMDPNDNLAMSGGTDLTEAEPPPEVPELAEEGAVLHGQWQAGDVIGVAAMGGENGWRFWFAQNGQWKEAEAVQGLREALIPAISGFQCGGRFKINFGQESFVHEPPVSLGEFRPVCEAAHGDTPVVGAARWGNTHLVDVLLPEGFDLTAEDRVRHRTLLHWAAFWGNAALTQDLLDLKADPFAEDVSGWTPLRAAFRGFVEQEAACKGGVMQDDHAGVARVLMGKRYKRKSLHKSVTQNWEAPDQSETGGVDWSHAMMTKVEIDGHHGGKPPYDQKFALGYTGRKTHGCAPGFNKSHIFIDGPTAFVEVLQLLCFVSQVNNAPLNHLHKLEFRRQCEDCAHPEDLGESVGQLLNCTPDMEEIDFTIFEKSKKRKSLEGVLIGLAKAITQPPDMLRLVKFAGDLRSDKKGFGAALGQFLNALPCVEVVDISQCKISASMLKELAESLNPAHPGLRRIKKFSVVQDWSKKKEEGIYIANILDKAPHYEKLYFSHGSIRVNVLTSILTNLKSPHLGLKALHFKGNPGLGAEEDTGKVLAGFLENAPNLTKIKIGECGIVVGTLERMMSNMKAPHNTLARLVLAGNKNLPKNDGIASLTKFLKLTPQLTILDLSGCSLSSESLGQLAIGLKDSKSKLQDLSLARNEGLFLNQGAGHCLAAILNDVPGLTTLDLQQSTLGKKSAESLVSKLDPSPHDGLQVLILDSINLTMTTIQKILKAGAKWETVDGGESTSRTVG